MAFWDRVCCCDREARERSCEYCLVYGLLAAMELVTGLTGVLYFNLVPAAPAPALTASMVHAVDAVCASLFACALCLLGWGAYFVWINRFLHRGSYALMYQWKDRHAVVALLVALLLSCCIIASSGVTIALALSCHRQTNEVFFVLFFHRLPTQRVRAGVWRLHCCVWGAALAGVRAGHLGQLGRVQEGPVLSVAGGFVRSVERMMCVGI